MANNVCLMERLERLPSGSVVQRSTTVYHTSRLYIANAN